MASVAAEWGISFEHDGPRVDDRRAAPLRPVTSIRQLMTLNSCVPVPP